MRVDTLRIGLVLGVSGGMLAKLLTSFECGGGGQMGDGKQWMSWIEQDDMIRVNRLRHCSSRSSRSGECDRTKPGAKRQFHQSFAAALHRPAFLRFPAWALKAALEDMARETMLGGQRVIPNKLVRHGFTFQQPDLSPMLRRVLGARDASNSLCSSAPSGSQGNGERRQKNFAKSVHWQA